MTNTTYSSDGYCTIMQVYNLGSCGEYEPEECSLPDVYSWLMEHYRLELSELFMVDGEEWEEWLAGLSATFDVVESIQVHYTAMDSLRITIYARICKKCTLPCGLAHQYCDGSGNPRMDCSGCGTEHHRHTDECEYNLKR